MSIISSSLAFFRQCGSDYLGFDIHVGLICHSLGLAWSGLGLVVGLGLELCGLVNITDEE